MITHKIYVLLSAYLFPTLNVIIPGNYKLKY